MKNKIYIQSESNDRTTDDVIQWLHYLGFGENIKCFFNDYLIQDLNLELSNETTQLKINGHDISKGTYWYRRGMFRFSNENKFWDLGQKNYDYNINPLLKFINRGFVNDSINSFSDNHLLKLDMLHFCRDLDIKFPSTLITDNSQNLKDFVLNKEKIISKPIQNPFFNIDYKYKKIHFSGSTQLLNADDVLKLKNYKFSPSFFQEYIEKTFEIRTFYLGGRFFSMAIFSQQNDKTKIDYRNYDYVNPNRTIPYSLPKKYEHKLHKLMKLLGLNCGSFDLIYTPKEEYYFLEVNPIGQFQWLSSSCNYKLEKLIAENLINNKVNSYDE